jgi:hypothetical protein
MVAPLEPWFYSADLAARLSDLLAQAQQQPQEILMAVYLDQHRAVLTGCRGKPWTGEFPEGKIRVPAAKAVSCPAVAPREVSFSRPPHPSALPLRRRGVSISPSAGG